MTFAAKYPNIMSTSVSPGFIDTELVKGMGATKKPEEGTVSIRHCLFQNITTGWFYGSDALRSPLHTTRDPGTPEYTGE